jgi:AbrB family looped-hinge helix DNA binding protein
MRLTGRMGRNGRTTVPREVRERLGLAPGDSLVYEVGDESVRLRRLAADDAAYLRAAQATLAEWDSPEDEAASAGLAIKE